MEMGVGWGWDEEEGYRWRMEVGMGDQGLTKAELGIRVCSSSCKDMAHQIPAAPSPLPHAGVVGTPQALPEDTTKTPGPCHLLSPRVRWWPSSSTPLTSTRRKPPRRRA